MHKIPPDRRYMDITVVTPKWFAGLFKALILKRGSDCPNVINIFKYEIWVDKEVLGASAR